MSEKLEEHLTTVEAEKVETEEQMAVESSEVTELADQASDDKSKVVDMVELEASAAPDFVVEQIEVEESELNASAENADAELDVSAEQLDVDDTGQTEGDVVAAEIEQTENLASEAVVSEVSDDEEQPILEEQAPQIEEDGRAWFVVHCYSGYENKVRHSIEQRIETMGMQDKIFDVVVPTEEEIEIKDGKRKTVERRVFPGYILVQLIMDEDSWYVVRNTPGVTGFVGMGNEPTPLRSDEVAKIMNRMEAEAPKVKFNFQPGEKVRIRSGPFSDFIGTVGEIDIEKAKVRVLVSFFGRETPVELDFLHVENI
jgi:transcriptional antiterminator NusG